MSQAATFAIPNVTAINAAALTALTGLAALTGGARAHVLTYDCDFKLVAQAAGIPALIADEVLASNTAGLVWQRVLGTQSQQWSQQTAWGVDAVAGNNQNPGTIASPVANIAEIARRVPVLYQPVTVSVVGNLAATDPIAWSPSVAYDRALSAASPTITINFTRTTSTPGGAGAIATATNHAANVAPHVTDAGVAAWPVGTFLEVTNGASNAAIAVIALDEGAGVGRHGGWFNTGTSAQVAAPAAAATYRWFTLGTAPALNYSGSAPLTITNCAITVITPRSGAGPVTLVTCSFPGFKPTTANSTWTLTGCWCDASATALGTNAAADCASGTFLDVNGGAITGAQGAAFINGLDMRIQNLVIQTGVLLGGSFRSIAQCRVSNLGIYGGANGVVLNRHGRMDISGDLYGDTHGTSGFQVSDSATVRVSAAATTPTLTGTIELLITENGVNKATSMPNIEASAGLVLPALAALATWAAWVAAPFNKFVLSYRAGGSITVYT